LRIVRKAHNYSYLWLDRGNPLHTVQGVQQFLEALLIDEDFHDGRHRVDCPCPGCEAELVTEGSRAIQLTPEGRKRVSALIANDKTTVW
jgi:hypothetical protein